MKKINNKLDKALREKLENIQPEYDPESWELMEKRLESMYTGTPDAGERSLDEVVFEKLHQLQVGYEPSSWRLMLARIDEEFGFIRRIYRYKAMEVALMLLLLLSFFQILPTERNNQLPVTPSIQEEQTTPSRKFIPDANASEQKDEALPYQVEQAFSEDSENEEFYPSAQEGQAAQTSVSNAGRPAAPSNPSDEASALQKKGIERPEVVNPLTSLTAPAPSLLRELERTGQQAPGLTAAPLWVSPNKKNNLLLLAAIRQLPAPPLSHYSAQALGLELQPLKRPGTLYFGMFGSSDYNHIITPPITVDGETVSANRYAIGYSGGFGLSLELGRWEVGSGLTYIAKNYEALPIVYFEGNFFEGYYGEGIKEIELNMLSIPLHFRYNVFKKDRLRLYATAGASLHVAVQANYYIVNHDGFRRNSLAAGPPPVPQGESAARPAALQNSKITAGWLEGGTFNENSLLTGNLGIGVERFMSTNWSLFAQPTYLQQIHHFDGGFGPYSDRISTFSILMGLRVKLNNQ